MIPLRSLALVGTLTVLAVASATPALAHQAIQADVNARGRVQADAHANFHERLERLHKQFHERLERLQDRGRERGRAEASARIRARALAGELKAIDGTTWTVDTEAHGDLRVDVSDARIRWPGRPNAVLADFKVGDHVRVQLQRKDREVAGQTETTQVLKARAVHFVPAGQLDRFRGTVTAVSAASLTLTHEGQAKTFTIGPSTTIRVEKELTTIASVKVGDKVQVVTRESDSLALIVRVNQD